MKGESERKGERNTRARIGVPEIARMHKKKEGWGGEGKLRKREKVKKGAESVDCEADM